VLLLLFFGFFKKFIRFFLKQNVNCVPLDGDAAFTDPGRRRRKGAHQEAEHVQREKVCELALKMHLDGAPFFALYEEDQRSRRQSILFS